MKAGVIVAMESEFELLASAMENKVERQISGLLFLEGKMAGKTMILGKSGIGKVSAAIGAVEMLRFFSPDCIINSGVAGGLDAALQVSDIILGEKTVYHDVWCGEGNAYGQIQGLPPYYLADRNLLQAALSIDSPVNIRSGLICSGDRFITKAAELNFIKEKFPEAIAVDMESCAIAQVCYQYSIPFISIRIISDTPGIKGHTEQYENFWKTAPHTSFAVVKAMVEKL